MGAQRNWMGTLPQQAGFDNQNFRGQRKLERAGEWWLNPAQQAPVAQLDRAAVS